MKLISFLLENIYWVIIVGGVLFSMFGKSGTKRRSNRMPSFGGDNESQRPEPRQHREWEDDEEEWSEPAPSTPSYQSQNPVIGGYSAQREGVGSGEGPSSLTLERAVQAASSRSPEPPRSRLSAANKSQVRSAAPAASEPRAEVTAPTADELRKAVVLAEILGPPRSKRPFGK